MKLEVYYDIGCNRCGRHYSTDFGRGMDTDKKTVKAIAKADGWKYDKSTNENICPVCVKESSDNITFV